MEKLKEEIACNMCDLYGECDRKPIVLSMTCVGKLSESRSILSIILKPENLSALLSTPEGIEAIKQTGWVRTEGKDPNNDPENYIIGGIQLRNSM